MSETQLLLNEEERQYLQELLEKTLKEMRVEEHRTRAPSYRERVIHKESLAQGLLNKLGQPVVA